METWYSKDLGAGEQADASTKRFHHQFMRLFTGLGRPADVALFSRHDRKADTVTVYFTPAASAIALAFKADPCDRPGLDGLGLLVGEASAWKLLAG